MHIPDGFLSFEVWAPLWAVAALIIALAVRKTNKKLSDRHVPLLGILAAFVFAAQMLNVPVAGGTSGHFLGGVLTAIFVGPLAGSLVMSSIFVIQAIFFQDGGITALGANIINMGLIGTIIGFYIYLGFTKLLKGKRGMITGAAVAAWISVVFASAACALELAASGTSPIQIALPAMVGIHAIIGIIEAAITVTVIGFVMKTRPDLLNLPKI
ncbi:MAG: cobalamin biosynthesis protein CbiM [Candidatus Hadarchaeum yellowstonense]|jgi:cobalt/nickel transport system permease protein|uniref:Cobalamin biosynthesis protein CbiM n=1 Tax=Hadarchaeum yellowstonense TaxID=1776334 RepID=A0A147JT59_HADYE|nr:MAG: cobalamin biosynthesis protein CbiM [Candidatus Hadarchaeum yellowstonense]